MIKLLKVDDKSDISAINEQVSDIENEWFIILGNNEKLLYDYIDNANKIIQNIESNVALITCDILRQITFQDNEILIRKIHSTNSKKYFNDLKQNSLGSGWIFNRNWFLKTGKLSVENKTYCNFIDKILKNCCSFRHLSQFGILRTEHLECEDGIF